MPARATASPLPPSGFSSGSCTKHWVHTRAVPMMCIQSIFRILLIGTQIKLLYLCIYLVMEKWGQFHFQSPKGLKTLFVKISLFYTKKVTSYFRLYWLFISVYFISTVSTALWTVWVHHLDIKFELSLFLKYINTLEIKQIKENSSCKLSGFGSLCFKNFLQRMLYYVKTFKQKLVQDLKIFRH